MKSVKNAHNKLSFINDENGKYIEYIKYKLNDIIKEDIKERYTIALVSGRYIIDTVSGICDCGVKYSVSENSLMWACPICNEININFLKCKEMEIVKIETKDFVYDLLL